MKINYDYDKKLIGISVSAFIIAATLIGMAYLSYAIWNYFGLTWYGMNWTEYMMYWYSKPWVVAVSIFEISVGTSLLSMIGYDCYSYGKENSMK